MAVPLQSFFCHFLGRTTLDVPLLNVFISDVIPLVTPHTHLSILISFTSIRASCPLVVAQVSGPYNRAGLTTVLQTVAFSLTGIFLSHNTPLHLFQFLHAALTRCVIYVAMPPVSSTLESIYLKCCTLCNSSPSILTGSFPWPLSCQKLKSMNWGLSTYPSGVGTGTICTHQNTQKLNEYNII